MTATFVATLPGQIHEFMKRISFFVFDVRQTSKFNMVLFDLDSFSLKYSLQKKEK